MPSGTILHSTHEAELNVLGLPIATRHGHIVPQLATQPLLSIGQLYDAGCDVVFMADSITISHDHNAILTGQCMPTTKLWELDIRPLEHQAHATIGSATMADLVTFVHAAMFSLALSTLEAALQCGHLSEFAGLMLQHLWQHLPQSIAMIKGHLDQMCQNQ